ncbi:MAG: hypothetical protein ABI586_01315 [Candidatus Nanopelagicales bacterium]
MTRRREGAPNTRSGADEAGRRWARLPERVSVEEMVESEPLPPQPEPAYDENVDAVRWYGIPL